jgi:predicted transport protein
MAMNPAITEEFKQLYVVYRAETLFLSVVPLSTSLTLCLNMPFPEIQDARHICRDVSNIGHWCSGDVELKIDAESDMTYVMALVGQAFEWQLEDVEVA